MTRFIDWNAFRDALMERVLAVDSSSRVEIVSINPVEVMVCIHTRNASEAYVIDLLTESWVVFYSDLSKL